MDRTASTRPNGQAPCQKPYTEPRAHAAANASTNDGRRCSNAYVTSIAVTATSQTPIAPSCGLEQRLQELPRAFRSAELESNRPEIRFNG
jgi:hypothetical protein